ncbi:MAG TPA: carboxypeptidase regulatory-like domain-containing protein, partial [Candidatus Acidoferrales bacterium]
MAKRSLGRLLLLVALGAVACLVEMDSAYAQVVGGSITGVVEDPTGAVVVAAKVTATDQSTNATQETKTDERGVFAFTNLRFGRYQVTAELSGFRRLVLSNVVVEVGQVARLTMRLELGDISQQVVVAETIQTLVNTETAELKTTVDRRQILDLPLPTRNPIDLARLMPGVTTPAESSTSFVHGLRGNATNILQDGINVADNFVKTSAFFAISAPTVENTGEFTVSVGTLGSDSGFGAAQVSIVTPRGQNAFHGSTFWFHRNDILNANDFFANLRGDPKP